MMRRLRGSILIGGAMMFLAGTLFSVLLPATAQADAWNDRCWRGWGEKSCSYFIGRYLYTTQNFGYPHSYVLPEGLQVNNKSELINTIRGYATNGMENREQKWRKMGAAFIIHTLLGRDGNQANANGGRWSVTEADLTDFANRINAATINFSASACANGLNTLAGTNPLSDTSFDNIDVMRTNDASIGFECYAGTVIAITDSLGNVYYINKVCGNPFGRMDKITGYNYNLKPSIDLVDNTPISVPQSQRDVSGIVANDGPTSSRPNINWRFTRVVYAAGVNIPDSIRNGGTSGKDNLPCSFYTGGVSCSDGVGTGTRKHGYVKGNSSESTKSDIGDYPVGTQICFGLSVQQYTQSKDGWRHSALRCLIASKRPKVQVIGGDLYVGRAPEGATLAAARVVTSNTPNPSGLFGSWVEYGLAATGSVTSMGSAAGYVGGASSSTNLLTFTNQVTASSCSGSVGCYKFQNSLLPAIGQRFPTSSSSPSFGSGSLTGLSSGTYRTASAAAIVISASAIGVGHSVILNVPNNDVIVTGNITYTSGPIDSARAIPQVVIIARNITIADTVTQVDSWLISPGQVNAGAVTNGVIRTCQTSASSLNAGVCDKTLHVTGPVVAKRLLMLRTAGGGTGRAAGDPAEVFNVRPDAYLWALNYLQNNGRITSVETKELPPRY